MNLPVAVVIHLLSALPALALGLVMFSRRKGTPSHKRLGKLWLLLMLVTAISSFWIQLLNPGHFSWIHLLSILTLAGAADALYQARRRNIRAHRRAVGGMYVGLFIAGGFAVMGSGRLLHQWLLG